MNRSLFENNLQILSQINLKLAKKMKKIQPTQTLVINNGEGLPTVAKDVGGVGFFLHSRYSIERELVLWQETLAEYDGQAWILFGLGLGYELDQLLAIDPSNKPIVLLEPDDELFYHFLNHYDLNKLKERPVYLFQGQDFVEFTDFFRQVVWTELKAKYDFVITPGYYYIYKELIVKWQSTVKEFIAQAHSSISTLYTYGDQWTQNQILNTWQMGDVVPYERLKKHFQDIPAIVVSAGPSLENDLPLLRKLYDKALIVPVGSGLSVLESNQVRAHMVASLDGNPTQIEIFRNLQLNRDVFLFYTPQAQYQVQTLFRQETFLFNTRKYDNYLYKALGEELIPLDTGGTVAASILDMLSYWGCSPIILLGQDLCYSKNQTYAMGAKYFSIGSKETLNPTGDVQLVKNKKGDYVYTKHNFLTMRNAMEHLVAHYPHTTYLNCSQEGLKIEGTMDTDLETVKKQYLTKTYDFPSKLQSLHDWYIDFDQPEKIKSLLKDIEKSLEYVMERLKVILEITDSFWQKDLDYYVILSRIEKLEGELAQNKYFCEVLWADHDIFRFLFEQISLPEEWSILPENRKAALQIEKKKRYYAKMYESCLIAYNAVTTGEQEVQRVRLLNGWYDR